MERIKAPLIASFMLASVFNLYLAIRYDQAGEGYRAQIEKLQFDLSVANKERMQFLSDSYECKKAYREIKEELPTIQEVLKQLHIKGKGKR